ncbi:hypothetical protein [Sporosarcina psychrophila]|uniref:Signal peptidase I n=1 Tax=Sporosarcina psychrophila TaxID=1476 RepID=A0ABV2KBL6_SPOPS
MAKLQNVTTVNMIDGEITAIKYNGAVYTKVDGIACGSDVVDGDIGLISEEAALASFHANSYYEAKTRTGSSRFIRFKAGNDGRADGIKLNRVTLFRKAETTTASAPFAEMVVSRVEAVEKRMNAIETKLAPESEALKVGDYVVIKPSGYLLKTYKVGDILLITGFRGNGFPIVKADDRESEFMNTAQIRKATDAEVAAAMAPPKPKTGDIVVITANTNNSNNYVGDIGKVGECRTSVARVEVVGGRTVGNWTYYTEMRLATPAEIKQYEDGVRQAEVVAKQAAKDSVFTKAGRKYKELRKDDVVRITDGSGHNLDVGDVGIITELSNSFYRVTVSGKMDAGNLTMAKQLEIVCFAENRVDAKGAC